MEYATEKPADIIELRIYPDADGRFTFYEDENDTYNYEHGAFATFSLHWNDRQRQLTVSDTKGRFPGMLHKRRFNVVLVDANHGFGADGATKIDKRLVYEGKVVSVKL